MPPPGATTFITATKPESGSEDLVQVPIFTMQNPTHNSPLSTNFVDPLLKRKRDTEEEMTGNDADPFPRASRTRDDPPKAHGPDSHFDIGSLKAKYGAIDKECYLHSDLMRKLNQFAICKMLEELKKKKLDELDIGSLEPYYAIIRDLEKLKIDMKWLVQRLDEIRDAIKSRDEAKVLEAQKNERLIKMEEKVEIIEGLQVQIGNMEDQVVLDNLIIKELNRDISKCISKFQRFQSRPLLDGLI